MTREATGITTMSTGNEVKPLINGAPFMSALLRDIEATKSGDFIHATMFEVNGDVMLDPPSKESTITKVLIAAIQRKVMVRLLVNTNVFIPPAISFCHAINSACGGSGLGGKTCCAPETRHHAMGGSLHAKTWVLQVRDEVVAYAGSTDIIGDRWDTLAHNDSAKRESEPSDINHFYAWHGDMFRMRGSSAIDFARHFWLQWNDPAPLADHGVIYKLDKFPWNVPAAKKYPGNLTVQLVRTLSCAGGKNGLYQTFAPRGEYSFFDAFKKMARQARQYIYVEDQFVFFDEALQAVADALPHVEAVVIVTDNATAFTTKVLGFDVTVAAEMRYYYQRKALDLLMKNDTLAKKVHIFELARPGYPVTGNFSKTWLYTHAKNYFADDAFMLVGSHGIERTGFTNDIELSVGVSDGTVGPQSYVGKLRRSLWGEFLQLSPDDPILTNVSTAIAEFERQAALGTTRVRHYYPRRASDSWAEERVYGIYEPEGRCDKGPALPALGWRGNSTCFCDGNPTCDACLGKCAEDCQQVCTGHSSRVCWCEANNGKECSSTNVRN